MNNQFQKNNKYYSLLNQIKISVIFSSCLVFIDLSDIPSKTMLKIGNTYSLLILFVVFTIIILTLLENSIFKTLKIPMFTYFDKYLSISFITICLYSIIIYRFKQLFPYKAVLTAFFLFISIVTIVFRFYTVQKAKSNQYQSNVIDIKTLLNEDILLPVGNDIFLDESAVDYDLLERDQIINHLFQIITSIKPNNKFVIGLLGDWGSGKTTIIKNVTKKISKNTKNISIIDDFDPWLYPDKESLFINMFKAILEKANHNYSSVFPSKFIDQFSNLLLGEDKKKVIKTLLEDKNIASMKDIINDYLHSSNDRFIFFIDNIDRLNPENILLLFNIVGNVLNFDKIIYVLSYDENRVKKLLEQSLNIDYEYINKIIQLQINVPIVKSDQLTRLYERILNRLLKHYGDDIETIRNSKYLIREISKEQVGIREFIRYVNSAITKMYNSKINIDKSDILFIEYIKFMNYNLYDSIYRNKMFFVNHDKYTDMTLYLNDLNKEKFNKEAKSFLDELFKDDSNRRYLSILSLSFPYIKKYVDGHDLESKFNIVDDSRDEANKLKSISSAKYFELYFTDTSNNYSLIAETVSVFIEDFNSASSNMEKRVVFKEFLNRLNSTDQKEAFERLDLFLYQFVDSKYELLKCMILSYNNLNSISHFLSLNAKGRAGIIINSLIRSINEDEFDDLIIFFINDEKYQYLYLIRDVITWFEKELDNNSDEYRKNELTNYLNNTRSKIINTKINLYDDEYYIDKNIWGIYFYNENNEELFNYVKSITNKNNIFRQINDHINQSIGSNYSYSINGETLNEFVGIDACNFFLANNPPTSSDEFFVLEVYNKFINENPSDNEITSSDQVFLKL